MNLRYKNILFGTLIGALYIATSLLFYATGKNINLNAQLNSTLMLLMITGIYIGGRQYKMEYGPERFSFGAAFKTVIIMVLASATIYSLYVYTLYQYDAQLTQSYLKMSEAIFREIYANSPMLDSMINVINSFMSAEVIAFTEFINKVFYGVFLAIPLALILRHKPYIKQLSSNE
ncbi:MAG: DUF4199 domain-containing protein [Marinifilaceae bacterium]